MRAPSATAMARARAVLGSIEQAVDDAPGRRTVSHGEERGGDEEDLPQYLYDSGSEEARTAMLAPT